MATIHLARAELGGGLEKLVAVKQMHEHLQSEREYRELFRLEASVMARLAHPNVCSLVDFCVDGEAPFLAMEYLAGETLARIVRTLTGRPWAPEWPFRAAHLIAEAAEGLHAAHELRDTKGNPAGVVHRDVSPNNLLLTYGGALKVLDFGIARPAGWSRASEPRVLRGKMAYVAPEQLAGREVDRRADVWSLGVTLWEMLTLEPLFHREHAYSTIGAVTCSEIPPPSSRRRRVPAALDAIVMHALERDPDRRFSTARELGRALVAFCRENVETFDAVDLEEFMAELFPVERIHKAAAARDALAARDESGLLRLGAAPADRRPVSRQAPP